MQIVLPEDVQYIIKALESAGFEGFAVGGCVRDSIMGRTPHDWDITTNARPETVKKLFNHTIDTGIEHGTVTVMLHRTGYEVTTYRIDGKYTDGRHPDSVSFALNLEDDLSRRDFTVNAMAYNESRGLVDLFGGLDDLEKKKIRCVGVPRERFGEDALRMLRALRFSATLGFDVEKNTYDAIKELSHTLEKVSAERIYSELIKLLTSDEPQKIRDCHLTGLTKVFMPEYDAIVNIPQHNPHHCYDVEEHTLKVLENTPPGKVIRLAALFHDMGKPACHTRDDNGIDHFHGHQAVSEELAVKILKRLKSDNDTISKVRLLVLNHDVRTEAERKPVRRLINRIGAENIENLLALQTADTLAQSDYMRAGKLKRIEDLRAIADDIRESGEAVNLKGLAVDGNDLKAIGYKPGRTLGAALKKLLDDVLEDPSLNTREYLLGEAERLKIQGEQ